ncbi:MAG: cell surface protein SprA [Rhodothermales bacterium]
MLAVLLGCATGLMAVFVSAAATDSDTLYALRMTRPFAPADTDSVAVDSSRLAIARADTDSVAVDTTRLAKQYIPHFSDPNRYASLFPRQHRPLTPKLGTTWRHEIELDSTEMRYRVREYVGKEDVRIPVELSFEEYRERRLESSITTTFRRLAEQNATRRRQNQGRGGFGFNFNVPGGRESAFSTIFGTTDIDLRVNGQANINAGFNIRKSDQQTAITGRETQVDPEFRQDLRLGIVGSIGDKMRIDVNWDTERDFDYQNQLKLQYQGYDDDIIKNIEAGNVFLQTPSSLIRGGQSLFGIKSEFQLGGIQFQTVVSQQEGQSNSLSIDGGSETVEFDLRPTDYDEKTHFFLSYYFRNRWETALSNPPLITVANGFERITDVELWKLQPASPENLELRKVIAVVDLGDDPATRVEAGSYTGTVLPNRQVDAYDETTLTPELIQSLDLDASDYQTGDFFKKLELGRDYTFDDALGYISLTSRLQESEALAVAFRYQAGGQVFQVGEFAVDKPDSDENLVLKLLRPTNLRQPNPTEGFDPSAWYLEMRNIYKLQGRGINPNEFELQVFYDAPGQPSAKTLPGVGRTKTLLQILGLDRLNTDESQQPDDKFDYLVNYTIDPGTGLLIFPYLEPFGKRIADEIEATVTDPEAQQEAESKFVFSSLYRQKKENARRDTQLDVYAINGSYKGGVQEFYDLRAYSGLVEGSVRVTAGGTPLAEGTDYVVDYQGGTVSITNPAFLTAGRNINIEYEQNSFFNIQKKTLLGARAYYEYQDKLNIGTTIMRLSQKSPVDKFRLGEEPISNTIWGLDGNLRLEPRWLTRAIDWLPLIQTRDASQINVTGEFAQLRPGSAQTSAFRRSRSQLRQEGRDFKSDELSGISYVDDFEGFETTFSLKQAGPWRLSAPPDSLRPGAEPIAGLPRSQQDSLRTNWRGTLAWYQLNINTRNQLGDISSNEPTDPAVGIVQINDVFPERDTRGEVDRTQSTLDLYFDPRERGPYNFNRDLNGYFQNPKDAWGGMTQRLPEGFNDFNLKNIEFVEFIVRVFPDGQSDAGPDAKLFVDLGSISEDVLPNGNLNNEDGLSTATLGSAPDAWGRLPSVTPDNIINVQNNRTEDLGLDGLASYDPSAYDPLATEQTVFANYLSALDRSNPDPRYQAMIAKIEADPSGDDYHYFDNDLFYGNRAFYPETPTIQQRFTRYFPAGELNAFEAQNKLANNTTSKRGNARVPDSEDLNLNSTVDVSNDYFQYEVPLSRSELDRLGQPTELNDFVVGAITDANGNSTGWYQIRIPVQAPTRKVGNIQDFTLIESIRMWTTGHEVPVTIRLATFDLVGSQWRKSAKVDEEPEFEGITPPNDNTRLTISSINNEEDADIYKTPIGTVISQTRLATGNTQLSREQSLVLRAENLLPGAQRAIFKTYSTPLDLLKYSNLRMFAHMHGELASGIDLTSLPKDQARDKVRLFVRLGANETNDYYEYEQPLTPSELTSGNPDDLWQSNQLFGDEFLDLNSVNILLGALNQLKVARDEYLSPEGVPFPTDSVFWDVQNGIEQVPGIQNFAPPGTRLGIRGTPSLGKVNTVVIGIRNPEAPAGEIGDELGDVTVWVNELRATGYDETNGWAALANVDMKLADVGRFKANFRRQTDGFGSLESTLGERDQDDVDNWSVAADFNLDKLMPERLGLSIPVSAQIQSNTSTPRFAPSRGDVRLSEIIDQIDGREDLTPEEKTIRIRDTREAAQQFSYTRSFSSRIQKQNSRNPVMRVLVDGISFNYSYSDTDSRSPSQKTRDSWRWTSNLGYRLTVRQPKTVRPFWFLDPIPVVGLLGDLRFNYLPNSINTSASATRNFSVTQQRSDFGLSALEEISRFPIREQHQFSYRQNFSLQYNPFSFLNLSFDTDTNQSLNVLGVDTLYTVVDLNRDTLYQNLRIDDAIANPDYGISEGDIGVTAFEIPELSIVSARSALSGLIQKDDGLRPEQHNQRFNATFQPNFSKSKAFSWVNVQPLTYQVTYGWQNAAAGRLTGASVRNQVSIRGGLTLRPVELWRKIPGYKTLEDQQRKAETAAQQKRRDRDQARAKRKEDRKKKREEIKKQREEEKKRKEEEEARRKLAEEQGIPFEEEVAPADTSIVPVPADTSLVNPPEDLDEDVPLQRPGQPAAQPAAAPADTTGLAEEAEEKVRRIHVRVPSPLPLLRRTVLAITGIRDLSFTYTSSNNASSSNVGVPERNSQGEITGVGVNYSLFDALLRGNGPSMRYRFGLDNRIPLTSRIVESNLQVTDVLSNTNRLQGQTTLNPSSAMTINLTWSVDWGTNENATFRPLSIDQIEETLTERGNNKASVWSFGANYLDFFASQLNTFIDDADRAANPAIVGDANNDGRVLLTNETMVSDFLGAYLRGSGTIDRLNLLPFPMPGWRINYTGLSNWPIFQFIAQSATLRHSYSADYSTDYRSNVFAAGSDSSSFVIAGRQIRFPIPEVEAGAVRINERYQPLVGLDLAFKNQMQANIAWNASNTYSLSTTSYLVNESKTNEITLTASYQKRGLKLPFIKKKLDNRMSLSLTLARAVIDDQRLALREALVSAIEAYDTGQDFPLQQALEGDFKVPITGSTRLTVAPTISYQFSNRVSGDFRLRFEKFDSVDSRIPSSTTTQGTFNIRVSIQN